MSFCSEGYKQIEVKIMLLINNKFKVKYLKYNSSFLNTPHIHLDPKVGRPPLFCETVFGGGRRNLGFYSE
jgi:hypothetical protein